jgi:adenylosuccinate lyase
VLANFADDMRHLQRSEIGEVGEPFEKEQVGSSTMPQKRNPINFENVKGAWKEFMPRMVTVYMNQISEHERDLTNSLPQRYEPELLVMFDASVKRINKVSKKLRVDKQNMKRNFEMNADKIVGEPLQILLSFHGHPNAHEKVRQLTMLSYEVDKPLTEIIFEDEELKPYLDKFTENQLEIIADPKKYIGMASKKTEKICKYWEERIKELCV